MEATLSPIALQNQNQIDKLLDVKSAGAYASLLKEMIAAWLNSDYFPDQGLDRENAVFDAIRLVRFIEELQETSEN